MPRVGIIGAMAPLTLDAAVLRRVIVGFHDALSEHREVIDNLNVYPVPDGDTGTNMTLTIRSVTEGLDGVDDQLEPLCQAVAHGALMGARGNSGVILAQILRGFSGVLRDAASTGQDPDAPVVARALTAASEGAYTAVARPVEGTILTVIREASDSARAAAEAGGGLVEVLDAAQESPPERPVSPAFRERLGPLGPAPPCRHCDIPTSPPPGESRRAEHRRGSPGISWRRS